MSQKLATKACKRCHKLEGKLRIVTRAIVLMVMNDVEFFKPKRKRKAKP